MCSKDAAAARIRHHRIVVAVYCEMIVRLALSVNCTRCPNGKADYFDVSDATEDAMQRLKNDNAGEEYTS